jgi:hypothetical protein
MESQRLLKFEKHTGFALVMANCVRLGFGRHAPGSVAVMGDILGLFGAVLYFRALYIQRKQNPDQHLPSARGE